VVAVGASVEVARAAAAMAAAARAAAAATTGTLEVRPFRSSRTRNRFSQISNAHNR
jgi:hypothetical protein